MLRIATSLTLLLLAAPGLAAPGAAEVEASDHFPSLLGGESLHGSSTAQALAGFATLSAAYGQGLTALDDLGGSAEFNWSTTELVVGAFWRRHLGRPGGWDLAARQPAAPAAPARPWPGPLHSRDRAALPGLRPAGHRHHLARRRGLGGAAAGGQLRGGAL